MTAPARKTSSVCPFDPVTMLPKALNEGVMTWEDEVR
jgi:hypothetical protein